MFRCPHIGLWLESRSNTEENLSCSCNLRTTTESEIWFILWTRVPDGMQTQTTTICLHILNTARYVVAKLWFFFRMYLWFSCLQQICRTEFINYLNWQNNQDMWSVSTVLRLFESYWMQNTIHYIAISDCSEILIKGERTQVVWHCMYVSCLWTQYTVRSGT